MPTDLTIIKLHIPFSISVVTSVFTFLVSFLFFVLYAGFKKDKSLENRSNIQEAKNIAWMTFFFFVYSLAEPLVYILSNLKLVVIITRIELSLSLFAMYFFLKLLFLYNKKEDSKSGKIIPLVFLIYSMILSGFMIFTQGLVTDVAETMDMYGWHVTMGPLFNFVFSPTLLAVIVYGQIKLAKAKKFYRDDKIELRRFNLIIIGVTMTMIFSLIEVLKSVNLIKLNIGDASVLGIAIMSLLIGVSAIYRYYHIQQNINKSKNQMNDAVEELKSIIEHNKESIETYFETAAKYKHLIEEINTTVGKNQDVNDMGVDLVEMEKSKIKNFSTMVIHNITTFEEILSSLMIQNFKMENFFKIIRNIIKILNDITEKGKIVSSGVVNLNSVITDAKNYSDKNLSLIKDVKGSIDDIETVNQTIEGISEESNILAMNAAIEAANSGELGSGFMVVAQDLRELAVKTVDETEKIENILHNLKNDLSIGLDTASDVRNFFYKLEETIEEIFNFIVEIVTQTTELIVITTDSEKNLKFLLDIATKSTQLGNEQQELNNTLNDSIIDVKFSIESIRRALRIEQGLLENLIISTKTVLTKAGINTKLANELKIVYKDFENTIDKKMI